MLAYKTVTLFDFTLSVIMGYEPDCKDDKGEDGAVGVMFRVQNSFNFYVLMVEK